MAKLRIAFDIDGVLIDIALQVKEIAEKIGIHVDENHDQFRFKTDPLIPNGAIMNLIAQAAKNWHNAHIYKDTVYLCERLYDLTNDPIYFVTCRPVAWAGLTCEMLFSIFPDTPFKVSFVPKTLTKSYYLQGYSYFVEDRRKIALELAENGFTPIVPDRPYNRFDHPAVVRVEGMSDAFFRNKFRFIEF